MSHLFYTMSDSKHLLRGEVYPSVVTVGVSLQDLKGNYSDSHERVRVANETVVDSVLADLDLDALEYDYDSDWVHSMRSGSIIDRRSLRGGDSLTDGQFNGNARFFNQDKTYTVGQGGPQADISVGVYGGSMTTWKTFVTASDDTVRLVDRWSVMRNMAHEHGHRVFKHIETNQIGGNSEAHHDTMGPFDIMEGTIPASEDARSQIFSGFARARVGWITPAEIDSTVTGADTTIVLRNAAKWNDGALVLVRTQDPEQQFLLECRSAEGASYLAPKGGAQCSSVPVPEGLLVTHLHDHSFNNGWAATGFNVRAPSFNPELSEGRFSTAGEPDPVLGFNEIGGQPDCDERGALGCRRRGSVRQVGSGRYHTPIR